MKTDAHVSTVSSSPCTTLTSPRGGASWSHFGELKSLTALLLNIILEISLSLQDVKVIVPLREGSRALTLSFMGQKMCHLKSLYVHFGAFICGMVTFQQYWRSDGMSTHYNVECGEWQRLDTGEVDDLKNSSVGVTLCSLTSNGTWTLWCLRPQISSAFPLVINFLSFHRHQPASCVNPYSHINNICKYNSPHLISSTYPSSGLASAAGPPSTKVPIRLLERSRLSWLWVPGESTGVNSSTFYLSMSRPYSLIYREPGRSPQKSRSTRWKHATYSSFNLRAELGYKGWTVRENIISEGKHTHTHTHELHEPL